jgi:hypothetical protein
MVIVRRCEHDDRVSGLAEARLYLLSQRASCRYAVRFGGRYCNCFHGLHLGKAPRHRRSGRSWLVNRASSSTPAMKPTTAPERRSNSKTIKTVRRRHLGVSGLSALRLGSAQTAARRFVMRRLSSSHTGIRTAVRWFLDSNGKAKSYAAHSFNDDGGIASHL